MAFGVFIHRSDSIYEDSPAERYQFPSQYLARVESCIGDWIIYYEPTKAQESRGYFAIARVQQVISDPSKSGMYIAIIEPNSYLDFASLVPFRDANGLVERGLLNEQGKISGRAQSAVRPISPADFNRITERGLAEETGLLPRVDPPSALPGLQETQSSFQYEQERSRVAYLTSRIVRDRIFRRVVLRAYDARCAITSLKLINGHGRAEVEAAHIRPVEANGPDIVSNGLALSGTAHWMFDRGLISIADNREILISRHVNDEAGVRAIINKTGRILPPVRTADQPHPHFLRWHRENCFKI
ncbi:HNH endonuclease [Bradyrhizobium sp. AUGA SZCCT0160]|uniref:HNH endonuclease n=1 Tax=Bradyrhizobium sp. AUGA SZCCT0160 TaxID=2807662 RepID=UPI001BA70569|nr:HNH endonuclease [Bradyrhizobium sp. AUGA SZCCT0160]MBR1190693.1 HNH endonuclease [Bradyrhizobium sp. AUGA SZCCT0160]